MHFRNAERSARPGASARVRPDYANGGVGFDGFIPRARLVKLSRTGSVHLRPIYAAMLNPGIGFLVVGRTSGPFAVESRGGFVGLIADDTDRSLGPAGFHRKSIRRLAAQPRSITLISSDIVPDLYAAAAALAVAGFCTIIVETKPEQEAAWLDLLKVAAPQANMLVCTVAAGNA